MDPLTYRPTKANELAGLPMFAHPQPAPSVPVSTSEAAGEAMDRSGRAATLRARLLVEIARGELGRTADELEVATGIIGNTVRPRLRELEAQELIEPSTTITRPTRTGHDARVYFCTTKGRKAVQGAA